LFIWIYLKEIFMSKKMNLKLIKRKFKWSFWIFVIGLCLNIIFLKNGFIQNIPPPFLILVEFLWIYGLVYRPCISIKCPNCGEKLGPHFLSKNFITMGILAVLEFGICKYCGQKIK